MRATVLKPGLSRPRSDRAVDPASPVLAAHHLHRLRDLVVGRDLDADLLEDRLAVVEGEALGGVCGPDRLDRRLVRLPVPRIHPARCGHAVDQVIDPAEPLGDQIEHLGLGGVREGIRVHEGKRAAELGGERRGLGGAIPTGGRSTTGGRRLLEGHSDPIDPVAREAGDRRRQPVAGTGTDHECRAAFRRTAIDLGGQVADQLGTSGGM